MKKSTLHKIKSANRMQLRYSDCNPRKLSKYDRFFLIIDTYLTAAWRADTSMQQRSAKGLAGVHKPWVCSWGKGELAGMKPWSYRDLVSSVRAPCLRGKGEAQEGKICRTLIRQILPPYPLLARR